MAETPTEWHSGTTMQLLQVSFPTFKLFLEGLLMHLISTSFPPYLRFTGEAHEETFRLQGRAEQQVTDRDLGIYGGVRSPGRGMAL